MKNLVRNKKGDVTDIVVILVIMVFLAISFIVVLLVNDKLRDVVSETALGETSAAPAILEGFDNISSTTVQNGFAIFMGILIIGVLVSSFLVRIHPAFIFLYIIVLGFTIFVSVFLGNMYAEFVDIDVIAEIAEDQTIITFFMSNIVKIALAVGALSMIIVFSKIFSSPGGGGEGIS